MDLVFATAMLFLLAPILMLIFIAIKLDSTGPALYRQRRCFQQPFMVYKFRTMYLDLCSCDAVSEILQARRNDSRVTTVGSFLRRTSLDELPQLVNVMRGEMSLVGPRPHALAHDKEWEILVGEVYLKRYRVKPGITGWAQVNDLRGGAHTRTEIEARLEYDCFYVDNWSLLFDAKILFMTMRTVFFCHRNAC